ncbi:MAG: adenylate cyclase, partial [Clostridia bacterium]|nr:adenylate cyclase [Clostridia bacterium]
RKLKVDDPVGAISVHGIAGAFGTILTGILCTSDYLQDAGMSRGQFAGIQILGVLSVIVWAGACSYVLFVTLKHTLGLRVSREEELSGLDIPEHGLVSAYADFMPSIESHVSLPVKLNTEELDAADAAVAKELAGLTETPVPVEHAVPVKVVKVPRDTGLKAPVSIHKLSIVIKQDKLDALKEALIEIGITGMTVTNVLGCGMRHGVTHYRGAEQEIYLHPRIEVEVVVSKIPVDTVVETAKKVHYTGHYGDGKIFVYDVVNVIKVRTGEEGYAALQDVEQF